MTTQSGPYTNVAILAKFLQLHPDEVFTAAQVRQETGLAAGSLHGTFSVLRQSSKHFTQPRRGLYCYDSGKTSSVPKSRPVQPTLQDEPKLNGSNFHLLGIPTSTGELVLQSDSGSLYLARKL
jgi:hypothetical protein